MALLWIFQAVFLDRYYELSMSRRCSKAVSSVCDYYASGGPNISYDNFMTFLGEKTEANDIYFWIESTDGTFNISSSEVQTVRIRANTRQLIAQARNMLKQSGLATLAQAAYRLLGLQSYFTAGEMEVKAWTIPVGAKAPQAAGVIHSDFERGFIKAQVCSYNDYVELGGEQGCKNAGKLRMEGKEYVVQDGDVMHFRHGTPSK